MSAEHGDSTAFSPPLGVRLRNDEQTLALGEDVHRLSLIEVEFPKFTDGRAFSQARILRDKLGYLPEGKPVDGYLAALKEFTAWYQPARTRGRLSWNCAIRPTPTPVAAAQLLSGSVAAHQA